MTEKKLNTGTAVALGNFDGLHLGHKAVLDCALKFKAEGYVPTVILFDVHPREFISGAEVERIMSSEETEESLRQMGFEIYKLEFSKIRDLTPKEFFDDILINRLNAKAVCCGFNYSFGKNGKGNSTDLLAFSLNAGIRCSVSKELTLDGKTVSSTEIKNYLKSGFPEKAAQMLGRNYSFCSEVIHGDERGRELGFPTANQKIPENLVIPKYGVYETAVTVDGKTYRGVTNIGIRPTYLSETVVSETNVLDFSGDIYGKKVKTELVKYLREERKFDSAKNLIDQLMHDVKQVSGNV